MGFLKFILILDLIGLVLAGLYALSMMGKRRPKNGFGRLGDYDYAHRGLHALPAGIPENSLRAFRLAANNGYGAELDVHLSRDGRLVIMHDENLKRTTGVNANISAVTTQVLSQLALEGTREKVPYLEEVLPLFNGKAPLLIEIKTDNNNYVELTRKVVNLLKQYPELDYMVESFDPRVLRWLKKHHPGIVRGQLAQNFIKDPATGMNKIQAFLLTNLCFNFLTMPNFIAYRLEDKDALAPGLCKKLWGVQTFYWVVRDQETANQLAEEDSMIIFEGFAAK
jgi:glycerophosphoryl diester phosphodiesterase